MFSKLLLKTTPTPESKVYISKKVEDKGSLAIHDDMIQGPHNSTAFLYLHYAHPDFSIIDKKTGKAILLPHNHANVAAGLGDYFATASASTVKIWSHETLKEIREFNIFNNPELKELFNYHGVTRSMQLLPDQHSLIGFTSRYIQHESDKVLSLIWVLNVTNGEKLAFDISHMLEHIHYKLAIIPSSQNRFVLYDDAHGKNIFVFEINFQNKKLNLIASHKLHVGSFFNLVVSPDGKYWAGDMRFGCDEPVYGIYVWRVDSDYNLSCIAKIFNAQAPTWNDTKLLYDYHGAVHEFDPANSTHTILSKETSYSGKFAPCFEPGTIQVNRMNKWETYQFHTETARKPTVAPSADVFIPKLSTEFGRDTLFKIPSENGLVTGKTPEAKAVTYHR